MDNETVQLIAAFGQKLETYGGNLVQIAGKQAPVIILQNCMIIAVFFLGFVALALLKRLLNKKIKTSPNKDYDEENALFWVATSVWAFFALMVGVACMATIIQWVLNPEYAAIQQIILLAKSAA
jgi:hypothetical protein